MLQSIHLSNSHNVQLIGIKVYKLYLSNVIKQIGHIAAALVDPVVKTEKNQNP